MRLLILFISLLSGPLGAAPRLKTGPEFYQGLRTATNQIPNQATTQFYQERLSSFPARGEFSELSKASLGVMISLSSLFCDQLIDADARLTDVSARWAHGAVDFTAPAQAALSAAVQAQILATYTDLLWQRSADASEAQLLQDMMSSAVNSAGSDPAETKKILATTCAAVAVSLQGMVVE